MNYGIDVNYTVPDLVNWSVAQQERIDNRAKEREQAYQNLMKMLGRGYGAYKMRQDWKNWKDDQAYWDDQIAQMDDIANNYYDPSNLDMSLLENGIVNNSYAKAVPAATPDWREKYANSHRYGVDDMSLAILGLA